MVQHDLDFNNKLTYGCISNQLLKEVPRAVDQASNRLTKGNELRVIRATKESTKVARASVGPVGLPKSRFPS